MMLRSVLKQQKIEMIHSYLLDTKGRMCLDIGGDNGIVSLSLRKRGGDWTSVDLEDEAVSAINWPEGFYRRDIGWRAIAREQK